MTAASSILAIDQGTTSSRAILFSGDGRRLGQAQKELPQHFPQSGWVEHDPEDIWRDTLAVMQGALADASAGAEQVTAIGRSEEHTSELQSLMRSSYAVFCLQKKKNRKQRHVHR